jgi:hypothetical protein
MKAPVLAFVIAFCLSGCGRREAIELNELEEQVVGSMILPLTLYEAQFPNSRITNVAQIFAMLDLSRSHRSHPYVFQERFRRFGERAGFTNSIYEKYVVVSAGITNHGFGGELLLMNAVPFRDVDRNLSRMVILRFASQDYRPQKITETDVQDIFQRNQLPIPIPAAMPAVGAPPGFVKSSYPPSTRIRMFFENLAYYYGPGRFFWLPMMLICVGAVLFAVILLVVWFARRSRPKEE